MDPSVTGEEIKALYQNYAMHFRVDNVSFEVSNGYMLNINGGQKYSSAVTERYNEFTKIIIENEEARMIEGTQIIDLDLLMDQAGNWVIESTFNGEVQYDGQTIPIEVGYNRVDVRIDLVDSVKIYYKID